MGTCEQRRIEVENINLMHLRGLHISKKSLILIVVIVATGGSWTK